MIKDPHGKKLDALGTEPHWDVFKKALKAEREAIHRMCPIVIQEAITEACSVESMTICSTAFIPKLRRHLEPANLATISRFLDGDVGYSSFLGMLIWYALASDDGSTWIVKKRLDAQHTKEYRLDWAAKYPPGFIEEEIDPKISETLKWLDSSE